MTFMDLHDKKDLIIVKTLLEIPQLKSLCRHTLSKNFEISKIITFMTNLLFSASLILCMKTVKTLAVNLEERNQ